MAKVFTIRLEKDLAENLSMLAKMTHRSKASTIRWLIYRTSQEFLPEELTNLSSESIDSKQERHNVHASLRENTKRKETTS